MQRYVAFLRGINLGKRRPPMAELKSLFEGWGFADVATFIASGNIVFSSPRRASSKLESEIAGYLEDRLGYEVQTYVRTAEEVISIAQVNPFAKQEREGVTIHVGLLHQAPGRTTALKWERIRTDDDEFRIIGREYYWLCRTRTLESAVWTLPEMKSLRLPDSTMRNITSIRRLIAKHLGETESSTRRKPGTPAKG